VGGIIARNSKFAIRCSYPGINFYEKIIGVFALLD